MRSSEKDNKERRRIRVRGIVQGVGFRPFVFRLAEEEGVSGWVLNDSLGVMTEAEAARRALDRFERRLSEDAPPLARVSSIESESIPPTSESGFVIRPSEGTPGRTALISPDVATCADCLHELLDPNDRRYRYPFINCTNCGPRYTIIRDVPYDRPRTTMASFTMCPECQREYDNPRDRRFHAQPNACAKCGPRLTLLDSRGTVLQTNDPVRGAARFLKEGKIVAVKGLGGFHLASDATSDEAVSRMRLRKTREEKPFAIMSGSVRTMERFAEVGPRERRLLESPERPIVLLPRKEPSGIAASVAPHSRYFGVMLPYTPLHHLLLEEGFDALVMTSGNVADEPICKDNDEALAKLGDIADCFLVHDREIHVTSDDSVVRADARGLRTMRRSRGYVPVPVPIDEGPVILAVGAELRNTVALTRGPSVFLSQHVGDIRNVETHEFFLRTVEHLKRILDVEPEIVAHDMHPDYLSTRFALALERVERVSVQHHHAHIACCMLEHGLRGRTIGAVLDGTGYGPDGRTWGGEFLDADLAEFERVGQFEYLPLPGGDRAVVEPWRTGFAALVLSTGGDWRKLDIEFLERHDVRDFETLARMMERGVNCPLSSGAGRVFDAVSALVGVCERATYEGQPAIELEAIAATGVEDSYPFDVRVEDGRWVVHFAETYRAVVDDVRRAVQAGVISARFHNTIVEVVVHLVGRTAGKTGLDRVCLSGGVFQNRYLCDRVVGRLESLGLKTYEQSAVPANDGGIALGQAAVARARKSGRTR
jgi:hydrogenase maturation protein HypF